MSRKEKLSDPERMHDSVCITIGVMLDTLEAAAMYAPQVLTSALLFELYEDLNDLRVKYNLPQPEPGPDPRDPSEFRASH